MADGVFNIAKGKAGYYASQAGTGNAALVVVLLKTVEADDTLNNYDDLGALLAAGGGVSNVEADFTNYARKAITSVTETVDDGANTLADDFADQTWTSAGGGTNNTMAKLLVCYDADTTAGTDSNIIPLTYHDWTPTTDGSDLTAVVDAAGFYGAS